MPNPNNKNFNVTVAWFYKTKNGHYRTMAVDPKVLDAINQVQTGGKLFLKVLTDEQRKHDNYPHAVLEFISKENVEKYAQEQAKSFPKRNYKAKETTAEEVI